MQQEGILADALCGLNGNLEEICTFCDGEGGGYFTALAHETAHSTGALPLGLAVASRRLHAFRGLRRLLTLGHAGAFAFGHAGHLPIRGHLATHATHPAGHHAAHIAHGHTG